MTARLLAAAERVDDYFAGRLGAVVPDETRRAILAELSAAVVEAKETAAAMKSAEEEFLRAVETVPAR